MLETPRADVKVPKNKDSDKPRSLLAMTALSLAACGILVGGYLLLSGRANDRDFSAREDASRNRYLNVRMFEALKTFEYGIAERADASKRQGTAPIDTARLLAGIPTCGAVWSKKPNQFKVAWAEFRGKDLTSTNAAKELVVKLEAVDRYLDLQGEAKNLRTEQPLTLNHTRWFGAVNAALSRPIRIEDHSGLELQLRCSDIFDAVNRLMPERCRVALVASTGHAIDTNAVKQSCPTLENLAWRGTTVAAQVQAKWRDDQMMTVPDTLIAQRNPWRGVPGCIYLGDAANPGKRYYVSDKSKSNKSVCENPEMHGLPIADARKEPTVAAVSGSPNEYTALDDARWSLPPSLTTILRPLDAVRQPGAVLYKAYTERRNPNPDRPELYGYGPNQAKIGGVTLDVGFSVELSIDARAQAIAQQVAACYTGAQAVCRALGIQRREDDKKPIGSRLLEQAMVRTAGVAIIDIASGRIEALAGALSPCTRQDYDGPGRGAECDARLPWRPAYRPDMLENPALFHDAMPASTVKPILAAAFLADGTYGRGLLAQEMNAARSGSVPKSGLRLELMKSDSARFLDRLFCAEKGFEGCERPWLAQAQAGSVGWNSGCADALGGRTDCGKRDALFGNAAAAGEVGGQPLTLPVMYGRLLAEPLRFDDARFRNMRQKPIASDQVRACAEGFDGKRFSNDDWEKCRGSAVNLVAEGWGQGHARASSLGVAGMMALLGAASNGNSEMTAPHLVTGLRGSGAAKSDGSTRLRTAAERFNLNRPVAIAIPSDAASLILSGLAWSHRGGTASSACEQVLSAKECSRIDWLAGKTGTPTFRNDYKKLDDIHANCERGAECSTTRPYKWYTAVYRQDDGSTKWQKAIAVLAERNWVQATGMVHGAGDRGPNPAAEIAIQTVLKLRSKSSQHESQ